MSSTWIDAKKQLPPKAPNTSWPGRWLSVYVIGWESFYKVPVLCEYDFKEKIWESWEIRHKLQISHWMPLMDGPEE